MKRGVRLLILLSAGLLIQPAFIPAVAADDCYSQCILQASVNFACGAVAADGGLVAWGTDSSKFRAQQRAPAECAKIGGRKCAVEAAICPDQNAAPPGPQPKDISWGANAYSAADCGAGWSQGKADRTSAEKRASSAPPSTSSAARWPRTGTSPAWERPPIPATPSSRPLPSAREPAVPAA